VTPAHVYSVVRRTLEADRAAHRYRVPRAAASDRDDARLAHEDLVMLDDALLRTEEASVLRALSEHERPAYERGWLAERLARVAAERRCRDAR